MVKGIAFRSLQAGCINCVGRDRSGVATSTYFLGGDIGMMPLVKEKVE